MDMDIEEVANNTNFKEYSNEDNELRMEVKSFLRKMEILRPMNNESSKESRGFSQGCSICLEEFDKSGDGCEQDGAFFPCSHVFHGECMVSWILEGKNTCPAEMTMGSPRGTASTPSDGILGLGQEGGEDPASPSRVEQENPSENASGEETASSSGSEQSGSSSSLLTSDADIEEEERPTWNNKGDPFLIAVSTRDKASMARNLEDFVKICPLGED
ncbi:E3 ubiquitin-protein ligase RNF13-like [Chenopodium quinoa]|uniref:E3 ubiquitin-protein ligase RNF13-like n=1 Tax=Chenopodium quinoa TaxID=63459 RepID=UPI000B770ACD|nr:E3 ubiquitin-protein ligase RNF13-like [Chenopodium quinoa]